MEFIALRQLETKIKLKFKCFPQITNIYTDGTHSVFDSTEVKKTKIQINFSLII